MMESLSLFDNSNSSDRTETGETRAKRTMDAVLACIALLLLTPLMIVTAILVAADGGAVFYRHRRIGRNGVPFQCLKFRTMLPDAEGALRALLTADPAAQREWQKNFKLKNDPRITWIGRFLRKSSIDELPQLINVIKGDMALVGPRPIVSDEILRYGDEISFYYRCRPGITGLWQISGRNDTSYAQRVRMDVEYAQSISLKRDVIIMIKTAKVVLAGLGAY